MAERIWTIFAAVFALSAGVLLWRNNLSAAFVTATLGAVAWFLSYRAQLGAKLASIKEDSGEQETSETSDEK